jgi:hypothetical protein
MEDKKNEVERDTLSEYDLEKLFKMIELSESDNDDELVSEQEWRKQMCLGLKVLFAAVAEQNDCIEKQKAQIAKLEAKLKTKQQKKARRFDDALNAYYQSEVARMISNLV